MFFAVSETESGMWVLYELEDTLHRLAEKTFIKKEIFDLIYALEEDVEK